MNVKTGDSLQRLISLVLQLRLGRSQLIPLKECVLHSLKLKYDPGLDDMLKVNMHFAEASEIQIYILHEKVVLEEWTFSGNDLCDELRMQIGVRAMLSVASVLPRHPGDNLCFTLDPGDDYIPIDSGDQGNSAHSDVQEELCSVVSFPYNLGSVKYRKHIKPAVYQIPLPPPRITQDLEQSPSKPSSFESIQLDKRPVKEEKDDTTEITAFLRKLEGRPSLPGLLDDGWLLNGEGEVWEKWEAIRERLLMSSDLIE